MKEPSQIRTYEKTLLDKIFREEREATRTITITGIIDDLIKKEAKRRGIK